MVIVSLFGSDCKKGICYFVGTCRLLILRQTVKQNMIWYAINIDENDTKQRIKVTIYSYRDVGTPWTLLNKASGIIFWIPLINLLIISTAIGHGIFVTKTSCLGTKTSYHRMSYVKMSACKTHSYYSASRVWPIFTNIHTIKISGAPFHMV